MATNRLNSYEAELAKQAQAAMQQEASTGNAMFFSLEGGKLSFDGAQLPNNEMAVIILDGIMENRIFKGKYIPGKPSSPMCYAFGRDEKEMAPHENCSEPQSEACRGCTRNEWKPNPDNPTKNKKECSNLRRLCLIQAGSFIDGHFEMIEDEDHFKESELTFLRVPVMSVKAYSGFVKQVSSALSLPPHGVVTRFSLEGAGTSMRCNFEVLGKVPSELLPVIMKRHDEAVEAIEAPYPVFEEQAAPAPQTTKKALPSALLPKKKAKM